MIPHELKALIGVLYLGALAGAGKTYALLDEVARRVGVGQFVLFVQPTKALIDLTVEPLVSRFPDVTVIKFYGVDDDDDGVVARITSHLKSEDHDPHVVFITWAAFLRLPFIGPVRWHLIIDEIPQVHQRLALRMEAGSEVNSHIDFAPSQFPGYHAIKQKPHDRYLKQLLRQKRQSKDYDDCYELLWRLESSHWDVFTADKDEIHIVFYALLNPSILSRFRSVLIAGANFTASFLHRYWSLQGVLFGEPDRMKKGLRYEQHENGVLLTIHYAIEQGWSKHLRGKDKALMLAIARAGLDVFGDRRFAWKGNKDAEKSLRELFSVQDAVMIPQSPHGRNDFDDIDCIMDVSANNPTPDYGLFLQAAMGWNREDVRQAMHREIVYQTIMRGSLRNPVSTNPKSIVVPDLPTANHLARYFDGCAVCPLRGQFLTVSNPVGRPKKHESPIVRRQTNRFLDRQSIINAKKVHDQFVDQGELLIQKHWDQTTFSKGNKCSQFFGSLCQDQETSFTVPWRLHSTTAFIKWLKDLSREKHASKTDTSLISPAIFNQDLQPGNGRKRSDVVFANGIFLDIDDGDMRPDDFAGINPGVKFVVYNTFSSKKERLRYRIWIPTKTIMAEVAYRAIVHTIIDRVADAGFITAKRTEVVAGQRISGIDRKYGGGATF